jgi:hypothetical protein
VLPREDREIATGLSARLKPHIPRHEEQEKLLDVAPNRIRVLTVLGVETGIRTGTPNTKKTISTATLLLRFYRMVAHPSLTKAFKRSARISARFIKKASYASVQSRFSMKMKNSCSSA